MQNHLLPPEEQPALALKPVSVVPDAHTAPPLSGAIGEEGLTETADMAAPHLPTEESTALSSQSMETVERETLLDKLITQARKQKKWRQVASRFYYSGIILFLICKVADLFGQNKFISADFSAALALAYACAAVAEGVTRSRWGKSVANLTNIDDVRAVGALAEALDIPDKGIRGQVEATLTRLLPRLHAEDAGLLNSVQRNCLSQRLKIEYTLTSADFQMAVLEALEKIGDAGALPAVEELATGAVTTPNGRRVQAAARKCLPVLRLRVRTQETSSTLLRASSAEEVGGASLLRPARVGNTNTPEQLLRASRSDPAEQE